MTRNNTISYVFKSRRERKRYNMNIREEKQQLTMLANVACQKPKPHQLPFGRAPPGSNCWAWCTCFAVDWYCPAPVLPSCHLAGVKCQSRWAGPCLQVAELRILQGSWRWAALGSHVCVSTVKLRAAIGSIGSPK